MKLLLMILFLPLMLICNVIGGLSALIIVAVVNGYCYVTELLEKAQDKWPPSPHKTGKMRNVFR